MDNVLTEAEIPQGVLDDLDSEYNNVILDLDGDTNDDTKSLKSTYSEIDSEQSEGRVISVDDGNLTTMIGMGYRGTGYLVRINETNDVCSVKRVIAMSLFNQAN